MIKILFCKDKKVEEGKYENLALYREKADLLWVDIEAAKDEELACLDEVFSFHELVKIMSLLSMRSQCLFLPA